MEIPQDIETLHLEFEKILSKYNLKEESNAQKLTEFITSKIHHSAKELALSFNMSEYEAGIILTFLQKGIEFKKLQSN
ncbi:MAG: hypothetical protein ACLFPL_02925 [Candidatus Nanoarchaeia archaeon]